MPEKACKTFDGRFRYEGRFVVDIGIFVNSIVPGSRNGGQKRHLFRKEICQNVTGAYRLRVISKFEEFPEVDQYESRVVSKA